jgi:hypothetical protein
MTVETPFGKMTFVPDADSQLIYGYLEQFAAAINARVAAPADKSIVIPTPTFPVQYSQTTPFGNMTFQYTATTALTLNALVQLASGINAIWNG